MHCSNQHKRWLLLPFFQLSQQLLRPSNRNSKHHLPDDRAKNETMTFRALNDYFNFFDRSTAVSFRMAWYACFKGLANAVYTCRSCYSTCLTIHDVISTIDLSVRGWMMVFVRFILRAYTMLKWWNLIWKTEICWLKNRKWGGFLFGDKYWACYSPSADARVTHFGIIYYDKIYSMKLTVNFANCYICFPSETFIKDQIMWQ